MIDPFVTLTVVLMSLVVVAGVGFVRRRPCEAVAPARTRAGR
jgi:hypothetical protein